MRQLLLCLTVFLSLTVAHGQIWNPINSPTSKRIIACTFVTQDTGWIITADTIYKTINGGTFWTSQNHPPPPPNDTRFFTSIQFINSNLGIIACGNYAGPSPLLSTILWTNDGGNNWGYKDLGDSDDYDSDAKFANPSTAYAISEYGISKKTTDGGTTWTMLGSYIGSGEKLFPINKDTVYFAGTNNVLNPPVGIIGKTVNGGASWNIYSSPSNIGMRTIYFNDYLNGWAGGYSGEIRYTTDAGQTWILSNTGITSCINDLVFTNSTSGWAVTSDGKIIYSADGGHNWSINYNGTTTLNAISFTKPNNIGYTIGDSGRVLKSIVNAGIANINKTFTIKIFPNPFSSSITLQSDKSFKDATLTLYNSFGQQVKEIKNISGSEFILHRDNLPSGLYFIRLTQDNKTFATEKLLVSE